MTDAGYVGRVREATLRAVVETSLIEVDGEKVAVLHSAEIVEAMSLIIASMVATSPEASSPDGVKRLLRRYARQLEGQIASFKSHAAEHGSPFSHQYARA